MEETKKYQSFYTKSVPIVDYMINRLSLKESDRIFEPCGGDGVFVEAILDANEFANIDICELNPLAVKILRDKFSLFTGVNIRECDTLLDDDLNSNSRYGGIYDKIIANPPYGAWQDYTKRAILKKQYNNLYIKETYALFLFRCLELLKEEGILSFIIPDTFLNLHMHKSLRRYILSKTKIIELALFPSSFFPGVNFGYANLSIITLQKSSSNDGCLNNEFKVLNKFTNVYQLTNFGGHGLCTSYFRQREIFFNPDCAFFINDNINITNAINSNGVKLGEIANCVTGFYSGNDKAFLKVNNVDLKNAKNYELVDINKINKNYLLIQNILEGIEDEKCFVPIVKGGNTKYWKQEGWFMNWSKDSVMHYRTDKKARFQNPQYYFKLGLGIPMISSSSITASIIENKLFDQSIVGVFPKDLSLIYYLLAFFNSPTCNKLIRTINPSANNPANYIKKIPIIFPTLEQKELIDRIIKIIINDLKVIGNYKKELDVELNTIIESIYEF